MRQKTRRIFVDFSKGSLAVLNHFQEFSERRKKQIRHQADLLFCQSKKSF